MRRMKSARVVLVFAFALGTLALTACSKTKVAEVAAASSDAAKIPITTTSEEARKGFGEGRGLSDRVLWHEAVHHFDKAIALDPEFASAELARANNSNTAKEFFEHQKKALALADKASEGEKLLIWANEAAANGEVVKQKEY